MSEERNEIPSVEDYKRQLKNHTNAQLLEYKGRLLGYIQSQNELVKEYPDNPSHKVYLERYRNRLAAVMQLIDSN